MVDVDFNAWCELFGRILARRPPGMVTDPRFASPAHNKTQEPRIVAGDALAGRAMVHTSLSGRDSEINSHQAFQSTDPSRWTMTQSRVESVGCPEPVGAHRERSDDDVHGVPSMDI